MPLEERDARDLGELSSHVREIRRKWSPGIADPEELWFRGQPRRKYRLLPGLFREDIKPLCYDEHTLFQRFRALGSPYATLRQDEQWDWYFLAQHHGLLTRLLDWSESLMTAVYFAVWEQIHRMGRASYDKSIYASPSPSIFDEESPAIWLMDAGTLNSAALGDDADVVIAPGGTHTRKYLPDQICHRESDNERPLALYPTRANHRIVAQQGVFSIHGWNDAPLEDLAKDSATLRIACIRLDRANLAHVWHDMEALGLSTVTLFPDLDRVALHVRWSCQLTLP